MRFLACIINFVIEALSRHSLVAAWHYMTGTPLVFLYNAFMIFVTFCGISVQTQNPCQNYHRCFLVFLGCVNGFILLKRVTPFNAPDLKLSMTECEFTDQQLFHWIAVVVIVLVGLALLLSGCFPCGAAVEISGKMRYWLNIADCCWCAAFLQFCNKSSN